MALRVVVTVPLSVGRHTSVLTKRGACVTVAYWVRCRSLKQKTPKYRVRVLRYTPLLDGRSYGHAVCPTNRGHTRCSNPRVAPQSNIWNMYYGPGLGWDRGRGHYGHQGLRLPSRQSCHTLAMSWKSPSRRVTFSWVATDSPSARMSPSRLRHENGM